MADTKHTFHVEGMHCASCVFYLEETLPGKEGVTHVKADLNVCAVVVSGDFADDPSALAQKLTAFVSGGGYRLTLEKPATKPSYRDFIIAVPAAATAIIGFMLLQQLGIVNLVSTGDVTYGTALLIGLIASVSTCLAVVGGLVLSLSASAAKNNARWSSQAMFHVGRLGGFFLLGGVIGSAGKLFQLGLVGNVILSIAVALVMLILGLNLLDTFPAFKRLQPKLPSFFAKKTKLTAESSHALAPLLVGIGTFFLPCGFTQSMQVYTLTTGSFLSGAMTMFFFALGTLPVLALLSFGALEISNKPWKGVFFKAAGLVVIVLALFNVWNALSALGVV
jgi:sulfite exporter TauE/SafE/copper chaperone CopZ